MNPDEATTDGSSAPDVDTFDPDPLEAIENQDYEDPTPDEVTDRNHPDYVDPAPAITPDEAPEEAQ